MTMTITTSTHKQTANQLSNTNISWWFFSVGIIHIRRKFSCGIQRPTVRLRQLTWKFWLYKLQLPPVIYMHTHSSQTD